MVHLIHGDTGPLLPVQPSPRPGEANDTIGIRDVVSAIRRRWRLVVVETLLATAAAGVYVLLATPKYEASAAIRIDDKQGNVPSVVTTLRTGDELLTDLDELRSRSLAAEVVDSVGLRLRVTGTGRTIQSDLLGSIHVAPGADTGTYELQRGAAGHFALVGPAGDRLAAVVPGSTVRAGGLAFTLMPAANTAQLIRFRVRDVDGTTADLLKDAVIGRSGPQTNVIDMRYRHPDPRVARDVLNTWAALFVARRQRVHTSEARSTARFLRSQLDTISLQLASAENSLRIFREREQVVSPTEDAAAEVTRLADLQARRSEVRDEQQALDATLTQIQQDAATAQPTAPSPYRRLLGFPTLLRNQAASEMLRSLSDAEAQRTALLTRRTLDDPDVRLLTDRIHAIEEQVRGLVATYAAGLAAQGRSMDASLAGFSAQLTTIPAKEAQLARLQRTPDVLGQLTTMLQTRLKEAEIAEAVEDPSVRVIDAATLPVLPVSPRPALDLALGALAGLLLGVGAAVVRERSSTTVQSRDDVRWASGIPVLSVIPRLTGLRRRSLLRTASPGHSDAVTPPRLGVGRRVASSATIASAMLQDSCARLQLNLNASMPNARVFLFTSALSDEGKTTTAASYAITLAQTGRRVLLVDGDLRRGTVHAMFGSDGSLGLADVLEGADLASAVQRAELGVKGSLSYLANGSTQRPTHSLLGSDRLSHAFQEARDAFDIVVVDSPPLNVVTDAAVIARVVDCVVVIARAGVTTPSALRSAVDQLRGVDAPLGGAVLTDLDCRRDEVYGAAYEYYAMEPHAAGAPA